jgi:hypothetical protein
MSVSKHGDGWTVDLTDGLMVWEFEQGMELSEFSDSAYPVFEELLAEHDISGMVTVVRLDDPFSSDVFEVWEQSARRIDEAGVDRWALVADGVKAISLRGKVDVGDVTVLTSEDRDEATEWAAQVD